MKTAILLVLLTVGFFLSGCIVERDFSGEDQNFSGQLRRLEGRWYKDGARDKATSIVSTRDGMEARDELGGRSRLVADGSGFVRALDWGLRAEIRNDRINWENGAYWARSTNR